jgi:hypothetical protein
MKLNKLQLKQIIKEEISSMQKEGFFGKLGRKMKKAVGMDPLSIAKRKEAAAGDPNYVPPSEWDDSDDDSSNSSFNPSYSDKSAAGVWARAHVHKDPKYRQKIEQLLGRPTGNAIWQEAGTWVENAAKTWNNDRGNRVPSQEDSLKLAKMLRPVFDELPEHLGGDKGWKSFVSAMDEIRFN